MGTCVRQNHSCEISYRSISLDFLTFLINFNKISKRMERLSSCMVSKEK